MASANSVSREPRPGTRHTHCRWARRPVASTELGVLISFGLKALGPSLVAATAMVISKSPIPIKEVAVGVRCKLGVAAHARNPHEHVRRYEIHAQRRNRLVVVVLRLHRTRPANVRVSAAAA